MKPLPNTFSGRADQKGYEFKVLDRSGDVVLLEKHNPDHESDQKFYEVAIVQHMPLHTWPNGNVTEAREILPGSVKWGTTAWSPATLVAAREKFRELIRSADQSSSDLGSPKP